MIPFAASLFFAFALALAVLTIAASLNSGAGSARDTVSRYLDILARGDMSGDTPQITARMTQPIVPEFAAPPAPASFRKVSAKIVELPRVDGQSFKTPILADYAKAA